MGEFFKGWRRKAGLVTLAMAIALFSLWMRSHTIFDFIVFAHGDRQHSVAVAGGQIYWLATIKMDDSVGWEIDSTDGPLANVLLGREMTRAMLNQHPELQFREWIIPYWSLVLPLTLLSVWLILARPRKAKAATGGTS